MRDSNHPSRIVTKAIKQQPIRVKRPGPVRDDSAQFQRARKFLPAMAPAPCMQQAIRGGS